MQRRDLPRTTGRDTDTVTLAGWLLYHWGSGSHSRRERGTSQGNDMDQWTTSSGKRETADTGEPVPGHVTVDAQRTLVRDVLPAVVEASPTAIAVFRRDRHPAVGGHVPRSGLGQYVARALVEANGGRLWLRSRRGGGTEAGFALPAYVDAA